MQVINTVLDIMFFAILMLIAEKAVLFQATLFLQIASGAHNRPKEPPLHKPIWKIIPYFLYLASGLLLAHHIVANSIGVTVCAISALVVIIVDIRELLRARSSQ